VEGKDNIEEMTSRMSLRSSINNMMKGERMGAG
jgi:hypothetical protein